MRKLFLVMSLVLAGLGPTGCKDDAGDRPSEAGSVDDSAVSMESDARIGSAGGSPASAGDMPCGPGRHLIHLAARDLRVTGVDLTQSYLDEARTRLSGAGLSAELIHADMRELLRPASFDAIFHLYSSFGYFDDPRDDLRLLRNMRESLRGGGCAVLELAVLDGVVLYSAQEHALEDGTSIVESASRHHQSGVLERDWEASGRGASGSRRRWQAKHRLYRVSELEQMLRGAGFHSIRVFGGFDGSAFVADAGHAVVVARV